MLTAVMTTGRVVVAVTWVALIVPQVTTSTMPTLAVDHQGQFEVIDAGGQPTRLMSALADAGEHLLGPSHAVAPAAALGGGGDAGRPTVAAWRSTADRWQSTAAGWRDSAAHLMDRSRDALGGVVLRVTGQS